MDIRYCCESIRLQCVRTFVYAVFYFMLFVYIINCIVSFVILNAEYADYM